MGVRITKGKGYMPLSCVPSVWSGCSVLVAEGLDLSAVGIAQLAHAVGESIFCREGQRCGSSQMTLGRTCSRSSSYCVYIIASYR